MARPADTYRAHRRNIQRDVAGLQRPHDIWRKQNYWMAANDKAGIDQRMEDAENIQRLCAMTHAEFALKRIAVPLQRAYNQVILAYYVSKEFKGPTKRTWSRIARQLTREVNK